MVNTLSKQVTEECFLNPAKGIHQKLKAKALLNGKMLKNFPLSLGARGGLSNTGWSSGPCRKARKEKTLRIRMGEIILSLEDDDCE